MVGFCTKIFKIYDDYMTPKSAWVDIKQYIPIDKVIWEPFYCDGASGNYLKELGFNVIHENIDFFNANLGEVIITNPPFSKTKEVLQRLIEIDKPFILILPSSKLHALYLQKILYSKRLQLIVPRRRIQFQKIVNGVVPENYKSKCNFDCMYYTYKMNLEQDIIFLK